MSTPLRDEAPAWIEAKLLLHREIKEAKVFSLQENNADSALAVAISLEKTQSGEDVDATAIIKKCRAALKKSAKTDSYSATLKIPKRWMVLEQLPITTAGAIDENALRNEVGSPTSNGHNGSLCLDEQIYQIISDVLHIALPKLSLSTSFIRLGGDSITAIEVMSRCMNASIKLEVGDILGVTELSQLPMKAEKLPCLTSERTRAINETSQSTSDVGTVHTSHEFPLFHGSYSQLIQLLDSANAKGYTKVEDVYPCTPVQDGMLLSQLRFNQAYTIESTFAVRSNNTFRITTATQIENAWAKVVSCHPALRTVFLPSVDDNTAFTQIVLGTTTLDVRKFQRASNITSALSLLDATTPDPLSPDQPGHRLLICETDENVVVCRLQISHAIVDGVSLEILFRDLTLADLGQLNRESCASFSRYVSFAQDQSKWEAGSKSNLSYWLAYTRGLTSCHFPQTVDGVTEPVEFHTQVIDLDGLNLHKFSQHHGVTIATVIQAAWGVVLQRYTLSNDVCFGYVSSGRDAAVSGLQSTVGTLMNLLVCRVACSNTETLLDLMHRLQGQLGPALKHQHISLSDIQHAMNLEKRLFNSLVSVIYPIPKQDGSTVSVDIDILSNRAPTEYDVAITLDLTNETPSLYLDYYTSILSHTDGQRLARSFRRLLDTLTSRPEMPVNEVGIIETVDIAQNLKAFNMLPPLVNSCTHWLIERHIHERPEEQAVVSWDRNLTYKELDHFATRLASKLQYYGVGPETIVALCFPKSTWAVVSMVAVHMAGGAFVPLDPLAPQARIRTMLKDVKAEICLCSAEYSFLFEDPGLSSLIVCERALLEMPLPRGVLTSNATPENLCYAIFTSGSTGKPKGILLQHNSICTSNEAYGKETGIEPGTRVLQFSAYTFDIGILDVLITLMRGACVCVISDYQRLNDLPGAIASTKANWAFLTPTVADLLSPSEVPGLKTLSLGGEAISKTSAERWKEKNQLYGLYGPAEASGWCAWNTSLSHSKNSKNIGKPLSTVFWVVDPERLDRIVPDGCIGELMLQGPLLGRGYVAADEKALRNWIEDTELLPRDIPRVRAYLTGDLVRRNNDGSFTYVGRKDTQVKINGQRTELAEIESNLASHIPEEMRGIVEMISWEDGTGHNLVALLWYTSGPNMSFTEPRLLSNLSSDQSQRINFLDSELRTSLPSYMVPSTYLIFQGQPERTVSDKISRRQLVSLARNANQMEILRFRPYSEEYEAPTTAMETQLQELWCRILRISPQILGINTSFLRVGGDSVTAIKLSSEARTIGIHLPVSSIFAHPKLVDMASVATLQAPMPNEDLCPFDLVPSRLNLTQLKEEIRRICRFSALNKIEDIYPQTPLQEGLMALSAKSPGSYVAKMVYRLANPGNLNRFKIAWEQTVEACAILRTRIVILEDGTSFQVVGSERIDWKLSKRSNLRATLEELEDNQMGYGTSLSNYTLHMDDNSTYFIWCCHHAVFDGWTVNIIMDSFNRLYYGSDQLNLQPYSTFVKHIMSKDSQAAEKYWTETLRGVGRANFPSRRTPASDGAASGNEVIKTTISVPTFADTAITRASVFRAAWAIILAKYCDTKDICFGEVISGRNTPIAHVDRIAGPMIGTVPMRIAIDLETSVCSFLQKMQQQTFDMTPFEQLGLQNIMDLGADIAQACDFASLLVVHPIVTEDREGSDVGALESSSDEKSIAWEAMKNYFDYPLVLQASIGKDDAELIFSYDKNYLTQEKCLAISSQLEHVVNQLLTKQDSLLQSITVTGPWDIQQACAWNRNEISIQSKCLTELFLEKVTQIPGNEAIFSSDGSMTYAELDAESNAVLNHLQALGLPPKSVIPICFEASKWAIISMIAVLKAGHAFMPIDPSHPVNRRRQLVEEVNAKIVLASSLAARSCRDIASKVIEVSPALTSPTHNPITSTVEQNGPLPTDVAYILFTSGSTGRPKGVVVEHSAICSSILSHGKTYGLGTTSRVLQFSSYVFDASICEIFTTLAFGGAVCVLPHTQKFQDTPQFISSARVNTAFLTPSFVNTFTPEQVPTLKVLVLGGEAPTSDIITKWHNRVTLVNGYGPTECCVYCTSHMYHSERSIPRTIGTGHHGFCWIVDTNDYDVLAPIGCTGELVIQSHALARGYYNDASRTSDLFPGAPKWLPKAFQHSQLRFYKTGDLARYNFDGGVEYVGRKDTQVKLRGQRLEIGEVEHSIRTSDDSVGQVAVEFCKRSSGDFLIAFLLFTDQESGASADSVDALLMDPSECKETLRDRILQIKRHIQDIIPAYMVPSFFVPLLAMPFVTSMKIDRRRLQALTNNMSLEKLAEFSVSDHKIPPSTDMEFMLRDIWSEILHVDPERIGKTESFLEVGGDSLSAIQLSSAARRRGINLAASTIFKSPRLADMALEASLVDTPTTMTQHIISPFSLLGDQRVDDTKAKIRQMCNLQQYEVVEDAYPCTPLQEGLLALSVKYPHSYVAKHVYRLHDHVDLDRLKAAWKLVYDNCDSQRLRIVQTGEVSIQVLVSRDFVWEPTHGHNLQSYLDVAQTMEMSYGSRLCRSAIVQEESGEKYLIWIIHHAVVDGWTMKLILHALKSAYDESLSPRFNPFSWFIKYTSSLDKIRLGEFWRKELQGARPSSFPPLTPLSKIMKPGKITRILSKDISFPLRRGSSITKGTILRAAWALLLSRYSGMDDLCFGVTASGRNAPLAGIENIAGPVIGTVPVRVRLNPKQGLTNFLENVQSQALAMMPYEQMGFQNISKLSQDAKRACELSSLLIVQPEQQVGEILSAASGIMEREKEDKYAAVDTFEGYFTFPVVIQCLIFENHVMVHLTYDSSVASDWQMQCLSYHYDNIVQQLLVQDRRQVADVSVAGSWDLDRAISYNKHVKDIVVNTCVHDLISRHALKSPDSEAIFSRGTSISYRELEKWSDLLATYLIQRGLQKEDIVAICFEKSAWAIVAMIGAMKSGGVFMPLDYSHPFGRSQSLIQQVNAQFIIGSPATEDICRRLSSNAVTLSESFIGELATTSCAASDYDKPTPTNAAYILFTSGSTGRPKGITVNHSAICSSIISHGGEFKLSSSSRVLQFASYVFDVSFSEVLSTLVFGGTVCVVSEQERLQGITSFINDSKVNIAMLTPSFTTTFRPAQVPSLKTVILGGEAPRKDSLATWQPHVRLLNGYAPAECCIYALTHSYSSTSEIPTILGKGLHMNSWIVEPDNHNRLAPIGCVGELLLHGFTMGRGYVNDEDRTSQSFLKSVDWLPKQFRNPNHRIYKSGDLVRYTQNGDIEYIGRKDTQVKLRGQRIELGEIEYNIKRSSTRTNVEHVAVEVLRQDSSEALIIFANFHDVHDLGGEEFSGGDIKRLLVDDNLRERFSIFLDELRSSVPAYMIPSLFMPVARMPFLSSMKIDRRRLLEYVGSMSPSELETLLPSKSEKLEPETEMEIQLRHLWATVLKIPQERIGKEDKFLQIGGDSISSIQLSTLALDNGIKIDVSAIFEDSRLSAMATTASVASFDPPSDETPFALIPSENVQNVLETVQQQCSLPSTSEIEDVYPCTKLQEGLMALSIKQPGSYISTTTYRLPNHVDVERFMMAWEQTVKECTNLRTRIVVVDNLNAPYHAQAVIKQPMQWLDTAGANLHSYTMNLEKIQMGYGKPLCHAALVKDGSGHYFVWKVHHAIYDGWSVNLVLEILHRHYNQLPSIQLHPYVNFIGYITRLDHACTREYWRTQLQGATKPSFPLAIQSTKPAAPNIHTMNATITISERMDSIITKASLVRAAWAVVLARYSDTKDVCFGATFAGRSAPVPGLATMVGPVIATVPIRCQLPDELKVSEFLDAIQKQGSEIIPHEQFGLQNIAKLGDEAKEVCDFNSLLVIQPESQPLGYSGLPILENTLQANTGPVPEHDMQQYFNYPLVVLCSLRNSDIVVDIYYDMNILQKPQISALCQHLDGAVQQLQNRDDKMLGDLTVVNNWDINHAVNSQRLELSKRSCTHWEIGQQIKNQPDAIAVTSWDGDLTYGQMGHFASRLVPLLRNSGVGKEIFVPICFPKSKWAIIAMLSVQMAGAAFVPVDPTTPVARLENILIDTKASLVLASATTDEKFLDLAVKTLILDESTFSADEHLGSPTTSQEDVSPDNASFVIFTSGSTGRPKGIIMEHKAVCSSSQSYGAALGIGSDTRVFQFSAYTFDVGVLDVLVTLMRGGCVCTPSDHDRLNNLSGAINKSRANWIFLTPTVADLLSPEEVPLLKVMTLGGEPIGQKTADRWKNSLQLHGLYGPAEASICSWNSTLGKKGNSTNIGQPLSSAFWVVEPSGSPRLAPLGCVGELIIEGPLLARGYLNRSKDSANNFIQHADWLPGGGSSRRVYRTGDLVRRNHDGSFDYVGRKDNQIKLHGQRIELEEIDIHINKSLPPNMSGIAAVITDNSTSQQALTAVLWYTSGANFSTAPIRIVQNVSQEMLNLISDTRTSISAELPKVMIPSSYLIFKGTPERLTSGKVNRKQLMAAAQATSTEDRVRFSPRRSNHEKPANNIEKQLQSIWSSILGIPQEDIGRFDHFLQIGGDSIAAIQLVSLANKSSLPLTVDAIFRLPQLSEMANWLAAVGKQVHTDLEYKPFSTLDSAGLNGITAQVAMQCKLEDTAPIQDVFPCTKLQQGLMALSIKNPGSYVAIHAFQLSDGVDIRRFKLAWQKTAHCIEILRTRIVLIDNVALQAVINEGIGWEATENSDTKDSMDQPRGLDVEYGSPLVRYTLTPNRRFVWAVHHALFDGFSLTMIVDTFVKIYLQAPTDRFEPFGKFINYTSSLDSNASVDYWTRELQGAKCATFPDITHSAEQVKQTSSLNRIFAFYKPKQSIITQATIFRAAWGIVLARYSDTKDICFGATVSGRQAPVSGLESIAGPTIATVPVRIDTGAAISVPEYLQKVQTQALEMVPFEQFGLQDISRLHDDAKASCQFSSLITVQPMKQFAKSERDVSEIMTPADNAEVDIDGMSSTYFTYPLVVQVKVYEDKVVFDTTFETGVVSASKVKILLHHFEHVARQLAKQEDVPLHSISVASSWDLQQAIDWNQEEVSPVEVLLHDLIAKQAAYRPTHEAIYSTGRTMTYQELDDLSTKLANHLTGLGVGVETVVPFCFEKSIWAIVSILGILKAGGAMMPLDPSHPVKHRQNLVTKVDAKVILVSPSTKILCADMATHVVLISGDSLIFSHGQGLSTIMRARPTPANTAYIIFSSGSTGTPKGIVIEHRAFAASIRGHGKRFEIDHNSRVMQFSSYVFDVSVSDILSTLVLGGTICVPLEEERLQRTAQFIEEAQANFTLMPPSFLRTLAPEQVPSLKTLLVGGEALTNEIVERWAEKVTLINAYGPAEVSVYSVAYIFNSAREKGATIGRGVSNFAWVADVDNPDNLAPIGCVGELILQGPAIARGYLGEPAKTEELFLNHVGFLPAEIVEKAPRFYRTGDLVKYDPNGQLVYLGRRDTQVKVRGQRVDLGDIEYQMKRHEPQIEHAIVDIVKQPSSEALIAFVSFKDDHGRKHIGSTRLDAINSVMRSFFHDLTKKLELCLPPHMVPGYFVPVQYMPRTGSGKIDRKVLREQGQELPREELVKYAVNQRPEFCDCRTDTEARVRKLWAEVLAYDEHLIGIHDNFYDLGGDSIRIVTLAKAILSYFNVQIGLSILNSKNTTVATMATLITKTKNEGGSTSESKEISPINLAKEVSQIMSTIGLDIGKNTANQTLELPERRETVFLTGATGYLGTQLLKHLLKCPEVRTVVALVRAITPQHGLERVIKTAAIAGWWNKQWYDKLEIWVGDLDSSQLGLGPDHWSRLLGESGTGANITSIVHNGAVVNWNADYDKLRNANVQSTVDLLQASLKSPTRPKFVFVSGGMKLDINADRLAMSELMKDSIGYVQSKFVAESVVYDTASQLAWPQNQVSVIKPGIIIGTASEGVANVDDFIWRLVAAASMLRSYPLEPKGSWISLADVDMVASTTIRQIFSQVVTPFVDLTDGISSNEFWELVNSELDIACEPVSWELWKTKATEHMNVMGESHPLWPVQHFIGSLGLSNETQMETSSAEILHLAIKKNVQYLKRIGYLGPSIGSQSTSKERVISRSTAANLKW